LKNWKKIDGNFVEITCLTCCGSKELYLFSLYLGTGSEAGAFSELDFSIFCCAKFGLVGGDFGGDEGNATDCDATCKSVTKKIVHKIIQEKNSHLKIFSTILVSPIFFR
jgi:hypothetical protein